MARVLVTGGAGFIGSHTVERLLADGHAVVALDNLISGSWENLAGATGPLERVEIDVCAAEELTALVAGSSFDAIIHLAAWASVVASVEQPAHAHAVNVTGTMNVLEAARRAGVRRLVVASSASVYGGNPPLPCSEDALPAPLSPYAAHKAACELLCAAYRATWGLEAVPLRYFNVFGRRQPADSPYSGLIAILLDRLRSGRTVTVFGDGEQTRDFIHVSDVAAINAVAALGPDPGPSPINVARGEQTSVLALLSTVRAVLRADATVTFGPPRSADVRHSRAAIEQLRTRLGYEPRITLREGLAEMLAPGSGAG